MERASKEATTALRFLHRLVAPEGRTTGKGLRPAAYLIQLVWRSFTRDVSVGGGMCQLDNPETSNRLLSFLLTQLQFFAPFRASEVTMTKHERKEPLTPDMILERAAELMIEIGASPELMVDRMLTYGAAQAVSLGGAKATGEAFRGMAGRIEEGLFAHLEPHARPRTRGEKLH